MSQRDICFHCGADKGLHHYQTNQCPKYGREAYPGNIQYWEDTTYTNRDVRNLELAAPELLQAIKTINSAAKLAKTTGVALDHDLIISSTQHVINKLDK